MDSSSANMIHEIITIYRKMKKGRNNQNIYRSTCSMTNQNNSITTMQQQATNRSFYDFSQYHDLKETKYIFYSQQVGVMQSNFLFNNSKDLFTEDFFWINIFDPTEDDLMHISNLFSVHDLTLVDIREKNTEEKLEIFNHYTFISMRLFGMSGKETEDIDFNILMFQDFIITTHDKPWVGIVDILNFLSLIGIHTKLAPDWVFFSVLIEFLQDLKYITAEIRPYLKSLNILEAQEDTIESILRINLTLVLKLHNLRDTIKPKLNILNLLKKKCGKRMRKKVLKKINETYIDFKEQENEVRECTKIAERCQDLGLAIVNMVQSREGNAMNRSMKWFTIITLIFLPSQAVAGLWGMNVKVPGQTSESYTWFWFLTIIGPVISIIYLYFEKSYRQFKKKRDKRHKPNSVIDE